MSDSDEESKKTGRPRVEFDLEQVEKLASLQCTYEEIGHFFGCSHDTVQRRMRDDPEFRAAMERGKALGKISLRRVQWNQAKGGSAPMAKWLGIQNLGQRQEYHLDHTSKGEALPPAVIIRKPLREWDKDEDDEDGDEEA